MKRFRSIIQYLKTLNVGFLAAASITMIIGIIILSTPVALFAQEAGAVGGQTAGWAFLAAGLSICVSVIGAGIALSRIGAAAMAALAEKPEIMGSAIVFAGLAEGLSIWGLIVAVLILGKV
ncbi:MAG: ATP synthase subunit C [candidate division WOR-3 bacterium]|nr:ATP synthase subunit C [candidate division WOR-3 bacterium]